MTRFSVSDENNNDAAGSSRHPLPKRPRITELAEETSEESDNSSSHSTNSITSDSEIEPNSDRVTLSDTDVLDCPICLDPLTIPVFQCENGHLACGSCCNKIRNKCPSCIMPIGYNRCRAMEKVLESVKTSCPNKQYGCEQKISYCQKLDHEKSCKFSPCSCPKDGCDFADTPTGLYRHVFVRHHTTKFNLNIMKVVELFKHEHEHEHDPHPIVLQEGKQHTVFVLNRIMEPLGCLINIICVAPTSSNMKFSYEVTAALDGNLIKFESSVAVTQKFVAQPPTKKFVLVTSDFFDSDGKLRLQLIIKNS